MGERDVGLGAFLCFLLWFGVIGGIYPPLSGCLQFLDEDMTQKMFARSRG